MLPVLPIIIGPKEKMRNSYCVSSIALYPTVIVKSLSLPLSVKVFLIPVLLPFGYTTVLIDLLPPFFAAVSYEICKS